MHWQLPLIHRIDLSPCILCNCWPQKEVLRGLSEWETVSVIGLVGGLGDNANVELYDSVAGFQLSPRRHLCSQGMWEHSVMQWRWVSFVCLEKIWCWWINLMESVRVEKALKSNHQSNWYLYGGAVSTKLGLSQILSLFKTEVHWFTGIYCVLVFAA